MYKTFFVVILICLSSLLPAQPAIKISSGTNINTTGNCFVVLENISVENNGNIIQVSGNASLKLTGTGSVNIAGTGTTGISNLVISKSTGSIATLQQNISLPNELQLNSGKLNLGNSHIILQNNAVLSNESETGYAFSDGIGYIQITKSLNAPTGVNPGNLGAVITSSADLGNVIIRRGHQSQQNGYVNGNTIKRYYDIIPQNNTGLNATLRINYLDEELNGLLESTLTAWKSENNMLWQNVGYDSKDATSNYVEKNNVDGFSRWTLSSFSNPLPVLLLEFKGKLQNSNALLNWKTENEQNTSKFEVERSTDGSNYNAVGYVTAANTAGVHQYGFIDNNITALGVPVVYYRLKQIDTDSRFKYSGIIALSIENKNTVLLYPNPATDNLNINISVNRADKIQARIVDITGREIMQRQWNITAGSTSLQIDISTLSQGMYYLQINGELIRETRSFIKK